MTHVLQHHDIRGREFLDCLKANFVVGGWPVEVDVLIDAEHPGETPAPLPSMHRLRGDLFEGQSSEGDSVARRVPGAWVQVAKGSGLQQREDLLEEMRVNVHP